MTWKVVEYTCPDCQGAGHIQVTRWQAKKCRRCNGKGTIEEVRNEEGEQRNN